MRLPLTLNIQIGRKLADKTKDEIMTEVVDLFGSGEIRAVQICYNTIRVTFLSPDVLKKAKESTGVHIFGMWCPILGGGPPVTVVNLFDYPYEETDEKIAEVFGAYGEVRRVRHQSFVSRSSVFTGTRLVSLVLKSGHTLPRFIYIDGYNCRIWYRGQPLICNLCAIQGHKSANCPNKDKCRRCGASGHFARTCPNPWGTDPLVVSDPPVAPAEAPSEPAAVSSCGPLVDLGGDPSVDLPDGPSVPNNTGEVAQGAGPSDALATAASGTSDVRSEIENIFAQDLSDFSSVVDSYGSQSILLAVGDQSNKDIDEDNIHESSTVESNIGDVNLIEIADDIANEIINESRKEVATESDVDMSEAVNEDCEEIVLLEGVSGGGICVENDSFNANSEESVRCSGHTLADDEDSIDLGADRPSKKRTRDRSRSKDPLHHRSSGKVQKVQRVNTRSCLLCCLVALLGSPNGGFSFTQC